MNLPSLLLWSGELPTADAELCLTGKPLVGWKILDLPNFPLETGYEMIHGAGFLLGHGHWHLQLHSSTGCESQPSLHDATSEQETSVGRSSRAE